MSKDFPDPQPAPDPYKTSAAQTSSNVNTAIANSWLQNANEIGPLGSVTYKQTGTQQVKEPRRDAQGNIVSTQTWVPTDGGQPTTVQNAQWSPVTGGYIDAAGNPTANNAGQGSGYWKTENAYDAYDVPTFTRETTLSPEQQAIYDRQTALSKALLDLGVTQTGRVGDILSSPFDLSKIGALNEAGWDTSRDAVENSLFSRLSPQLDRDKASLESTLVNQGFQRGTQAFNDAMDEFNRQSNDARNQVVLAGGQEQSRMAQLDMARRQQAIQEALLGRQQPLNEIIGILNGTQVQMPQFSAYNPGSVNPTDVSGNVYRSAQIDQQNYQSQLAAQSSANAGMFGLGSSLIGGLFKTPLFGGSDRRLKKDVEKIGSYSDGLGRYKFRYIGGDQRAYVGVMADEAEVLYPHAVREIDGFKHVDYGALQ